jgi:hypothetical protein
MVAKDDLFERLFSGEIRFKPGHSFLIEGKDVGKAFGYFADLVNRDHKGLQITRQHPDHLATSSLKERPRVIWLSTTLGKDYVDPQNLGNLTGIINEFTENNKQSVILMEGLEYLMISNDFQRIIRFLEYVNEIVMRNKSILFLAIDERAFGDKELALLERNLEIIT